jgi:tetratricopeptide (TPR) repeat protein
MDFRASGNRFIPLLDQIFALLTTPFPVPHPPAYQRLLRSYRLWYTRRELEDRYDLLHIDDAQEKQYILAALSTKEESPVIKNLKREFNEYFNKNEFEKALDRAEELVFDSGKDSDYFFIGLCYSRLRKWRLALDSFQRVIDLKPESHLACLTWFNKGLAWIGLKDYREALRNFGQAIEIEPTFAPAWNKRDWILDFQGKPEEILRSYKEEIRRHPENKIAWTNKCWVYSRLGKYAKARKACEKALEIDQDYPLVWNNLGDVYQGLSDMDEARKCYEKAIALDPNCVYAILNLAKLLFRLKQWDDGIGALVKGLASNVYAEEPYTGDIKEFIHILLDEHCPVKWENYIGKFAKIYEENNAMIDLGLGLVQTIPCILLPSVDELEAQSWQEVWVRIVGDRDEFSVPLRLLDAAITLKQQPGKPLISLKLSIEERELFKNLQKEACALKDGKTNVQEQQH